MSHGAALHPASVSVVVTTYNWPEALEKVLQGLARQTRLPDEVIVADDGSGEATRQLLQRMASDYPVPLRHSWIPDQGFRAALSRNRGIAAASGDYLIMMDGDMVPHPRFISDHLAAARPGMFVQGMRVLTNEEGRDRLLAAARPQWGFFDAGIKRRRHTLRVPLLARVWGRLSRGSSVDAIKTCNQGWWRHDLLALNGFDERYEGWGREDKDLAVRAVHAGLQRKSLRFAGLAAHLYHRERHDGETSPNDHLLAQTLRDPSAPNNAGLDRHVEEFHRSPLADLRGATITS